MKMWTRAWIIFAIWTTASFVGSPLEQSIVLAQELPPAAALVDRHVEAVGGRAALERHTSRHLAGSFDTQGISGTVEVFSAAPARSKIQIEIPSFGTVSIGYDGRIGWRINPAFGPEVIEGYTLDQLKQNANFYDPLHSEPFVVSRKTVALTELDGRSVYKVKVKTRWDEEYFQFYDVETGRLAGTIRTYATPVGDAETTVILRDYEEVDGVWLPMTWVQRSAAAGEQLFKFTTAEFDQVQESVFELPAEIKPLLKTAESSVESYD
ncbi:MAG: hypothetical protein P8Y26_07325 [Gemmatimonadales bacterium]